MSNQVRKRGKRSAVALAKAMPLDGSRIKCALCNNPEWKDVVEQILEAWADGELDPRFSKATLYRLLREHYGYNQSTNTVRRCPIRCHPKLWQRVLDACEERSGRLSA